MPILENVLIKDGKISATDTQLTIISKLPVQENILLPFKKLQNILNAIEKQDIIILQNDTDITLQAGTDSFSLGKAYDLAHYPIPQEVDHENEIGVGEEFFQAIQNASKHESPNEQLTLHGINISGVNGNIEIAATDAKTIYVCKFEAPMEFSCHTDAAFCRAVEGWTVGKISFGSKFISCSNEHYEIHIQLLESKFPDYGQYMDFDSIETNCVIPRKELDAAIKKCTVFEGSIKTIKFWFIGGDKIAVEYVNSETNEKASTRVTAEYEDVEEGHTVGLSSELLQRVLVSLPVDAENISFFMPADPEKPVYVKHENIMILIAPSLIS